MLVPIAFVVSTLEDSSSEEEQDRSLLYTATLESDAGANTLKGLGLAVRGVLNSICGEKTKLIRLWHHDMKTSIVVAFAHLQACMIVLALPGELTDAVAAGLVLQLAQTIILLAGPSGAWLEPSDASGGAAPQALRKSTEVLLDHACEGTLRQLSGAGWNYAVPALTCEGGVLYMQLPGQQQHELETILHHYQLGNGCGGMANSSTPTLKFYQRNCCLMYRGFLLASDFAPAHTRLVWQLCWGLQLLDPAPRWPHCQVLLHPIHLHAVGWDTAATDAAHVLSLKQSLLVVVALQQLVFVVVLTAFGEELEQQEAGHAEGQAAICLLEDLHQRFAADLESAVCTSLMLQAMVKGPAGQQPGSQGSPPAYQQGASPRGTKAVQLFKKLMAKAKGSFSQPSSPSAKAHASAAPAAPASSMPSSPLSSKYSQSCRPAVATAGLQQQLDVHADSVGSKPGRHPSQGSGFEGSSSGSGRMLQAGQLPPQASHNSGGHDQLHSSSHLTMPLPLEPTPNRQASTTNSQPPGPHPSLPAPPPPIQVVIPDALSAAPHAAGISPFANYNTALPGTSPTLPASPSQSQQHQLLPNRHNSSPSKLQGSSSVASGLHHSHHSMNKLHRAGSDARTRNQSNLPSAFVHNSPTIITFSPITGRILVKGDLPSAGLFSPLWHTIGMCRARFSNSSVPVSAPPQHSRLCMTLDQIEQLSALHSQREGGQRLGSADSAPWQYHPEVASLALVQQLTLKLTSLQPKASPAAAEWWLTAAKRADGCEVYIMHTSDFDESQLLAECVSP